MTATVSEVRQAPYTIERGFHGWVIVPRGQPVLHQCPWCATAFPTPQAAQQVAWLLWPQTGPR